MYTTIRPKVRVLINLFILFVHDHLTKIRVLIFYLHTTIRPNYRVFFHLLYSFFSAQPFDQKLGSSLIYFFHLLTTIRQNYMIFFLSFILCLCTTIRPKNRVLINLLFLFVHNHSTKLGVTLTFLFIIFLDVPIFCLLYSWQILPLYFHHSVSSSTAFIFRPLYS